MPSQKALDIPSQIDAMNGEVVLRGPDGLAISLTPAAAEETARRLQLGAAEARRQPPSEDDEG